MTGLPNPSRETKFSGANADREIFIFPVQLTTSRIGSLTRLIHILAVCVTIHTYNSMESQQKQNIRGTEKFFLFTTWQKFFESVKESKAARVLGTTSYLFSVVCVCVFFPFILDIKFVGRTSRGHTGGRSHRISFCGLCLNFSRENDSAIPFPRQPCNRILCTIDLIVLHPLGIFYFYLFLFFSSFGEKNSVCRDRTHVPTCQRVTRYLRATGRSATRHDE